MIETFISDLKSIPSEEYEKFFTQAQKVAKKYPLNEGIDCFARGETIEWAFIDIFSKYINIKPSDKKEKNDPDGVYMNTHLWDVKTKKNGLIPQEKNPQKIKSKQWDFKKTQTGVSNFKTKSEWYVLIDPWTSRLAVMDAKVLFTKNFTEGKSRICFSVATEDITMIYDGLNTQKVVEDVLPEQNMLYKMIWESV